MRLFWVQSFPGPVGTVALLVLIGLVFLALEILVLPGFGVAGIMGILTLLGASGAAWYLLGPVWGAAVIVGSIVVSIGLTVAAFRTKALRKHLVLDTKLDRGGSIASSKREAYLGRVGTAHTDLKPSGVMDVGGERIDVVSEGGFISRGTRVKVIALDGPRIVVAPEA